jgi:hypothetical protein
MKKWAHELNRKFSKEEVQITNKNMKKCSTFLVKKRCKSKLHLDFISLLLEWPYSRAITKTYAGEDVVKHESLYTVGWNAN